MGPFSAFWCSRRRSRVVRQVTPPTEASQKGDVDVRVASPIHSSAVPSPSNADVAVPAASQGYLPSTVPEAVPTEAQITIPQGPTLAGSEGTPASEDLGFNPGQAQLGAFPGPQNNRVAEPPAMSPSPSSPPGPNGSNHHLDWSLQNHPSSPTQPGGQGLFNESNSTAPPTPSATNSSIAVPSPSAVNGTPSLTPAAQPTSTMLELPASFLTDGFMQSVTTSLDGIDPQGLFRPGESGIDFEQFREWFDPPEEKVNGR